MDGDKRHDATPHRRQQAREQGQVPRSHDLASAALLLAALLLLYYLGGDISQFFTELAQQQFGGDAWLRADADFVVYQWHAVAWRLAGVMLPLLGVMMLAGATVHFAQVGFRILPQKVAFDLSRVSPLKGAGRLFSLQNTARIGFGIVKLLIVAAVAAWSVWGELDRILAMTALDVPQAAALIAQILFWTCLKIGVALLVIALLDYGFQYWKHEQDLKMTDQELREEMKNLQGDPQVIARRRQIQRQLVLNRLSSAVPRADVVVTNPTELAVAIRYEFDTMPAPIVVAKGAGVLAQRIRRLALEHSIPIVERKELARALYAAVEVNQAIPTEQYAAVAEVLRYVYQLKGKSLPSA
jgi:flagellar biosynthetic protein FlhB